MPRRKRKPSAPLPLSIGPLPAKLTEQFAGQRLVFSDANRLQHGGLAAVLFEHSDTASHIATRSIPAGPSNELELRAAVFALQTASQVFAGAPFALFADNSDAIERLQQAQCRGSEHDGALQAMFPNDDLNALLAPASLHWIKGHGRCRGNALADEQARLAARQTN